jgi:hypothetical protein
MNNRCKHAFASFVLLTLFALPLSAAAPNNSIVSKDADVDGIKLHHLIAGRGPR